MTQLTIKQTRNTYLVHRHASGSEALSSMFENLCADKKLYQRWEEVAQGDDIERNALELVWSSEYVEHVHVPDAGTYELYRIPRPRQLVQHAVVLLEDMTAELESQTD